MIEEELQHVSIQEAEIKDKKYWQDMLNRWVSEPMEYEEPSDPSMPFRDRDNYESSRDLNPNVVDPFQQGYMDGKAAGKAQIDADPDFQIKSSDPVHQQTIDAAIEGQEEGYRDGFHQGYSDHWPSTHGTNISSDMPLAPAQPVGFKDSPPVNRDFNKWKP